MATERLGLFSESDPPASCAREGGARTRPKAVSGLMLSLMGPLSIPRNQNLKSTAGHKCGSNHTLTTLEWWLRGKRKEHIVNICCHWAPLHRALRGTTFIHDDDRPSDLGHEVPPQGG